MTKRVEDPDHYLSLAFDYYVAGRFAFFTHMRIAANLLHHAIELALKHALLKDRPQEGLSGDVEDLKRRYSHNIVKLWSLYKSSASQPSLIRFDSIVAGLNRWEDLRYGGFPTGRSTAMMFTQRRGGMAPKAPKSDVYDLVLEDIDELFAEILETSGVNPEYLGVPFSLDTTIKDWYLRDNQFSTVFHRPSSDHSQTPSQSPD